MATIYLSSTYEDLKDFREAVIEALRKENHLVTDSYEASPQPVPEKCLADVRKADIYVGLFAWRYGWRPEDGGASITELEYREAVKSGKAPLIFLRPMKGWPSEFNDGAQGDVESLKKIQGLRAELGKNHTPDEFGDKNDLALKVTRAVHRLEDELAQRIETEKRERSVQLGEASSIIAPLPPPHPRQLNHGLLLIAVRGTDETACAKLVNAFPKSWQVKCFLFSPEICDDIATIDALVMHTRVATILLSPGGLQRLKAGPAAELLMRLIGDRLGRVYGFLDQVDAKDVPDSWRITANHTVGAWLKEGSGSLSGELADLIAQFPLQEADINDPALIGLPWTLIAMTSAEAEALELDPQSIDDELGKPAYDYFSTVTQKLGQPDWTRHYGEQRHDWRPFGDQSILRVLEDSVRRFNTQPVVMKRDHQALLGNRIRLRSYPFDLSLLQEPVAVDCYKQMRSEGCLVITDELSLLHPLLNPDAREFLGDSKVTIAVISALDPSARSLDNLIDKKSPLNIGVIRDRFDIRLDFCCEFGLNSPARLRRWLRVAIPETLIGGENSAADPDRRAEFRRLVYSDGR